MNISEAIKIVISAPIYEDDAVGEALNVVVEASMKQEKMKVYERPISDGTVQLECPSCHCEVRIEFLHPYCWHCGQAIDWED